MNSTDEASSVAAKTTSSAQSSHANRYGDPLQDHRLEVKAPIEQTLQNSMKILVRRAWRIGGASLVVGVIGFLWLYFSSASISGPSANTFSIGLLVLTVMSGAVGAIGIVSGAIASTMTGKFARELEQLQSGHYLARWDLEKEQWAKYISDEKRKSSEVIGTAVSVFVILGLLMWFPMSGLFSPLTCIAGVIGLGILGYLFGLLIVVIKNWRLEKMDQPQMTIVGHDGLYFQGTYNSYSTFGSGLESVESTSTESMDYLVFTFYNQTKNGKAEYERRVPIPDGKKLEAKRVLKQFSET